MSLFLVWIIVRRSLEYLRAKFFWDATIGERKMHWVRWDRILASRGDVDLGVASLSVLIEPCWLDGVSDFSIP